MTCAKIYRLETINLSGMSENEVVKMKGQDVVKLQNELAKVNSGIVDVGASNVEAFMLALAQQPGAHQDYDYFVIPIEATDKKADAIDEFLSLVELLNKQGVEPERIKVLFNKLAVNDDLDYEMRKVIKAHQIDGFFTLDKRAIIHNSPAFAALSEVKKTFSVMCSDKSDYRREFRATPIENETRRLELTKLMRAQSSVKPVLTEFDTVFEVLFAES
nr:putative stabilization protein [Polaromonas sp.]